MIPSSPTLGAEAVGPPLRILFFNVPNGIHMPAWTPSAEGSGFEITPILQPLAKHRSSMTVMTGLTLDGAHAHGDSGGDHARSGAAFLTGAHARKTNGADIKNSVSVDQVAAQVVGGKNRFASLELGLEGSAQSGECDTGYSCAYVSNLSWRTATSPLPKEIDPSALFDRMFTGGADTAGAAKSKAARIQRRKSILDFVLEDAKDLQRKLGNADQRKLDEYLYAVRDVENRIVRSDKLKVGADGIPNYPRPAGVPREWGEHCRLMMDLTTLAIQSDATRILTFMYANEGSNQTYPEVGVPEAHHEISHHGKSADKQEKIQKINTYHVSKFAAMIDQFAAIEEPGGKLLDHCLVLYGSGISDGDRHNHNDLPIVLLGKAGGRLKGGQHLRFPENTPLCNLYLWMLKLMGVQGDSFGDSTGVLKVS
jgi:hypothetical protein